MGVTPDTKPSTPTGPVIPAQRLKTRDELAGNPKNPPKYATNVHLTHDEKIPVADPRATRAMVSLMDMNAVIGGAACHYGGPAAFAELMSAAHGYVLYRAEKAKKQWHEMFHLINDAGHCENGLYALKANYGWAGLKIDDLKKFRSIASPLTGHGESHLWPQGVFLSNGPLGSACPQSQGLAMADKHAGNTRVTITAISDGACMEGEAREAFAAIPGLAKAGKLNPFVLLISDNNTKLSGRIDDESFSMGPSFTALEKLGWKMFHIAEGNNLQSCFTTIMHAVEYAEKHPHEPVAVHAKTVKGIGTKKTAESSSGAHGFPLKAAKELPEFLKEIYHGEAYPSEFDGWIEELKGLEAAKKKPAPAAAAVLNGPNDKIQVGVSSALVRARKEGLPIVSVTSDLPGSTGVAGFRKEFPADSFDIGVAESNMVSAAAGFSKLGAIPVVDTFAQFGVTKGALPHVMAQLSEAPMIAIYSHTGFQDAADGASHQALGYLAMTMSIPGVRAFALSCRDEADALVYQAVKEFAADRAAGKTPHSYFFFLGRENFPYSYAEGTKYALHKAQNLVQGAGAELTLVPSGSMVPQALEAAAVLAAKGVKVNVCHASAVSHPDVETLAAAIRAGGHRAVVIEDHQVNGGFGHHLAGLLATTGEPWHVQTLGVREEFGRSAYSAQELYHLHGIDAAGVVGFIGKWKETGWKKAPSLGKSAH